MHHPAVPHMDLRGAHQKLADIFRPGRQPPDQQEVGHQIEIDRRPLAGDFKRQGRLANLPDAQQTNGRVPVEHCRHGGLFVASLQYSRSMAYLRGLIV